MQFDIHDPEVQQDIRHRDLAMKLRRIGALIDNKRFQKGMAIVGILFAFFYFPQLLARLSFLASLLQGMNIVTLVITGWVIYCVVLVGVLMAFKYSADAMISKLAKKYTVERERFIRSQFEMLGLKTSKEIYPAEFVNESKRIVIQKDPLRWQNILATAMNNAGNRNIYQQCKVDYEYRLDENYGSITITYKPTQLDGQLNNRNTLGIRDFDMMFKLEWDDEVKARAYLSSTKVLELLRYMRDIDNFVDKTICINGNAASFSYPYEGVLELTAQSFPNIDSIIDEAKYHVSITNRYLKKSDEYAYIVKKI